MLFSRLMRPLYLRAWRLFNNLRRPHPSARRAVPYDETADEEGVQLYWQGDTPPAQVVEHSLSALHIGTLAFTRPFVLSLRHGSVVGKRGDVVTAHGTIFTNVSPEIPRRPHHHFLLERGNLRRPRYIDDSVAVLNCGPYRNYFHFLFEAIGRLRFYQQANVRPAYYCVAYALPFQRELLAYFGVEEEQVIPLRKGTHVVAREMWVTSLPGFHSTEAQVHVKDTRTFSYVRQMLLDRIVTLSGQYAPRIYIQRRNRRTLMNEDELLAALSRQNHWEVVRLEEHSVLEQAAIFYHAHIIVAVHGAGLANLVYTQTGAQVVEIFSAHLVESVYFQIATWRELRYHPVISTSPEADSSDAAASDAAASDAVWVDPQQVLAHIGPTPVSS